MTTGVISFRQMAQDPWELVLVDGWRYLAKQGSLPRKVAFQNSFTTT